MTKAERPPISQDIDVTAAQAALCDALKALGQAQWWNAPIHLNKAKVEIQTALAMVSRAHRCHNRK